MNFSLWAVRMTTRRSTGKSPCKSPYELVYGTQALFPTQLARPMISFLQEAQEEPNALVRRLNKVIKSSESKNKVKENLITYQENMKSIFDRKAKEFLFQTGYLVLRWDTRRDEKGKHGKFNPLWYGPYKIVEVRSNNTFILENLDGETDQLPMNGQYLKHYFQH